MKKKKFHWLLCFYFLALLDFFKLLYFAEKITWVFLSEIVLGYFFSNFIYIWLFWVLVTVCGLSLLRRVGTTLHYGAGASHCGGFSCFTRSRCMDSVVGVHGLGAPWRVESSQTRDQAHVPCIGKQILIYCTTREVPKGISYMLNYVSIFVLKT